MLADGIGADVARRAHRRECRPDAVAPATIADVPATSTFRAAPERALRSSLLWLSRRRSIGRLATRLPVTRSMVARFVAGETLDEALVALGRLHDAGFRTTVDVLGEAVTSNEDARSAADQYIETLDALAANGLDRNVSVKLSQMGLGLDAGACRDNVRRILERAAEHEAFVRIDMEDHSTTDATLALWRELRPVNAEHGESGVVIQAALRRSPTDVEALIAERARVRLCKGAYVEPAAVAFPDKTEVDAAYATLMERLLGEGTFPAIATHDERLIARAVAFARERRSRRTVSSFRCSSGFGATFRSGCCGRVSGSGSTCRSERSGIRTSCAASPSGRRTSRSSSGASSARVAIAACRQASRRADRFARESKSRPWRTGGSSVRRGAVAVGGPPDESESRGRCGFSASEGRLRARVQSWRARTGP